MNKSLIITCIFLVSLLGFAKGQKHNVVIAGQIVGYDGQKEIPYAISNVAGARGTHSIKPDSLGRFIIKANIKGTRFFSMYYGHKNLYYHCQLILKPDNRYSFISEGSDKEDWRVARSPDIYTLELNEGIEQSFYKYSKGQVAYNLIQNHIHGAIFNYEWDLNHPESVLDSLEAKISKKVLVFDKLLKNGEITQGFYAICKLNTEYTYAERLACSIGAIESSHPDFVIKDSIIRKKLYEVYPKIFEKYPINADNARLLGNMFFYTDLYLKFLEDYKDGVYKPVSKRSKEAYAHIYAKSGTILPDDVNRYFQQEIMMGNAGTLGSVTSEHIQKYLTKNEDMKDTYGYKMIEDLLLPRVEDYEQLANNPLPDGCNIINGDSIDSFEDLATTFKGKALLVDCWGTWCGSCRYQFKYMEKIKDLLKEKDMEMVYAAYEYGETKTLWESMMKAYDLKGFHFVANDDLKSDLRRIVGDNLTFPNFIIIDAKGKVVNAKSAMPSKGNKLYEQIEEVIKTGANEPQ